MNRLTDALLTFRGIAKYYSFLRTSDRLPLSSVHKQQVTWLRDLLIHSQKSIPWYGEQFRLYDVRPYSHDPFAELQKLPILTKSDVRDNHSLFCSSGCIVNSLKFTTSGTTGQPLTSYTSPNQWIIEQACIWRQWKWAGYKFRDRLAIFRSYAPKIHEPSIRLDHLRNWAYFSTFRIDDASLLQYSRFLMHWKPRFIRGYPSSLFLVAQHAIRYGWSLPSLKAAFVASEQVTPILRQALRNAFGIEVFDHYGQAEITCMFHDCEKHEGMHVDWEYGYVELVPTSTPGLSRIIATNLHNKSMPLLRYDTGDLAEGHWEKCTCGRVSPKILRIFGRSNDMLVCSDNSKVPVTNIYTFFSKIAQVKRFQIVQHTPGEVEVILALWENVSSASNSYDELCRIIISFFIDTVGVNACIIKDGKWSQSAEGKLPPFVQNLAL